jgi:predicted  nucleic acid-binding Zn-ribbon protein
MQTDKRYATLILESLLDQRKTTSTSACEAETKLQDKLNLLETNYSKMEADYFKKIRDLKSTLLERTRKQAVLNSEVSNLREEFKNHQQEISRITEEIANEKGRSNEPKVAKKNSSPGLLKKSLET